MSSRKVRIGISFDSSVIELLDEHVKKLAPFHVDRSEIVNSILDDFFEWNGTSEAVWGAVSKRRVKRRS